MQRLSSFALVLAGLLLASSASAQLRVGPGETYTTIAAAAAAATDGATIEIAAGTYNEEVVWSQSNLTIRGLGTGAIIDMTGRALTRQGGKGIFIIDGADVTLENLGFVGASVPDGNGAGIRWQGMGTLTVRHCVFRDNENGILGGNHPSNIAVIEENEFVGNGRGDYGFTHNLYINSIDTLTFRGNWSHALVAGTADVGHLFKSRARHNYVLYNRLTSETAHCSYELQIPQGGTAYVIGNLIEQANLGPNRTVISIGGDGMQWAEPHVFLINNTVVNRDGSGTFINATAPIVLDIVNNLFIGAGTMLSGGSVNRMSNNLMETDAVLVGAATYDYHLVAGSAPVNAGIDPGSDGAVSLLPSFEYAHPHGLVGRSAVGAIDIGAYELGSTGGTDGGGLDAGSVADGGSTDVGPGSDGGARDAAGLDAGPEPTTNGGCCRVVSTDRPSPGLALLAACLMGLIASRRTRR